MLDGSSTAKMREQLFAEFSISRVWLGLNLEVFDQVKIRQKDFGQIALREHYVKSTWVKVDFEL